MLYLEDYLEIIEHLPQELRDRFTEMREMDLQVQNAMDSLDERVKHFFAQSKKLKPEQREADYKKLRQDYYKVLEDADEKVQIGNQMYDLVDRYLRRLDQELQKFKMELEADNAGITEILERRSLELDNPPQSINHQPKPEKRKYSIHSTGNHSEKRLSIDKMPATPIVDQLTEPPLKYRSTSGSSTPILSTPPAITNHVANSVAAAAAAAVSSTITTPAIQQPSIAYSLGHMGAGSNAIAAAASQAIAATQQMQQGRRTASLKASFEVVSSGLQGISREFSIGRDTASAGSVANPPVAVPAPIVESRSSGGSTGGSSRQKKQSRVSQPVVVHSPPVVEEVTEPGAADETGQGVDWTYDPNEPRYCICNQVSYGDMVACDNTDCPFEWFHYACVNITQPPKGKWYCPQCISAMRRRGRKEK